jgi:hypothetical protein
MSKGAKITAYRHSRAGLLVLALFFAERSDAQSTYGSVVGRVTDATGGTLPGVTVVLTEVQTNVVREGTTDDSGSYQFLNLTQGRYRVEAALDGFETLATEPFPVAARQTVRIDASLEVRGMSEEITVIDAAPLIDTESATVSGNKTNKELQDLPFTFRTSNTSPIKAIAVIPEVYKGADDEYSLSGSLPYQNEVSVDGILTTNVRRNGIGDGGANVFPSIEGIQEIRVSSINNNAEFAQIGDITTITTPGTNSYGGTLFINYNSDSLNANPNVFDDRLPAESDNYDYGGSLGGPIVSDKTFFFVTYERLAIDRSGIATSTVPEADFRNGDFSRLQAPILDPSTGSPFPGNVIPQSRINPVAQTLLNNYIPAPNDGLTTHRYGIPATTRSNQFDVRLDQNFRPGHTLFGRLSWKDLETVSPTTYESLSPQLRERPSRNFVISDNLTLGTNVLNEFRFGFTLVEDRPSTAVLGPDFVSELGLNLLSQNLPEVTGTSYIDIAGYSRFGEPQEEPLKTKMYQFADNVSWLSGNHTFKAGFDAKYFNWTSPLNFTGADDYGVFRFNNNLPSGTGNPVANFLLGIPTEVDQTASGPDVDGSTWHYGMFLQDEWVVSDSVALSLGVRYDLFLPFIDNETNISNFLRDTPNGDVVVPNEASRELTSPGFAASLGTSQILTAAEAGLPESLRRTDKNNISPRFGIAWRPFGQNDTVIRGGFGIYTTRILGAVFNSLTGIHTSDNNTFSNQFASGSHTIVWPETYAGEANRGGTAVGNQNFSTANDPDFKDPRTYQWSATFERELNRRSSIRVTYSGHRSVDLTLAPDLNQIEPNTVGFNNLPREARPFPNWRRVNTRDNGGYHNYHDVTIQARGNLQNGLLFNGAYRYTHSLTNVETGNNTSFTTEINGRTDNRFDPDYFRGKTQAIPDHRFVASLVWDLPVGRGKAIGDDFGALADALLGGWTVSSIVTAESGQHLTAYYTSHCGSGTNCYFSPGELADAVPGQDPNEGPGTVDQWFNTAAFSDDAFFDSSGRAVFAGRFGNSEKGSILGPGVFNLDLAFFKDLVTAGQTRVRFQCYIKNLTNHLNYGNPNTNLTSADYGRITTLNPNYGTREIVLGLRFLF